MLKFFLIFLWLVLAFESNAEIKDNIIKNLNNTNNLNFNFEQNVNGKIEKGKCTIEYPKKIFCEYDLINKKILVSNGKSLVIKTLNSYYLYPLEKTPLDLILNKNFLLEKIKYSREKNINENLINFNFVENNKKINLFFDRKTFNFIGWQTIDMYQNLSITYLSSIKINQELKKKIFLLPNKN